MQAIIAHDELLIVISTMVATAHASSCCHVAPRVGKNDCRQRPSETACSLCAATELKIRPKICHIGLRLRAAKKAMCPDSTVLRTASSEASTPLRVEIGEGQRGAQPIAGRL